VVVVYKNMVGLGWVGTMSDFVTLIRHKNTKRSNVRFFYFYNVPSLV